jgi:hypothetical protein
MSDSEQLAWLLRLIVTAGGPEKTANEPEEIFRLRVAKWMLAFIPDSPPRR